MIIYERQEKLKLNTNQSLVIVGCGGIGYWVAKYAAMSGIEKMYVFDDDVIEENNLNRLDLPNWFIGKNKADVVKTVINTIRPDCTCYAMPYRLTNNHMIDGDWLVDCTDKHESQLKNQEIAKKKGLRYVKAGYDGEQFSIHNSVAEWGESDDGYTVVPSWVVPASIIAAMTVAKITKYPDKELVSNVPGIFESVRK